MKPSHPSEHPELSGAEKALVRNIATFTRWYFQNPKFDSSHDFQHVVRVTNTAIRILEQEQLRRKSEQTLAPLDPTVVILAALLHDVEDKKYISSSTRSNGVPRSEISSALRQFGASESLTTIVSDLVPMVSFSAESRNPELVSDMLVKLPELAVVQDADRLDAIGAIGIGRCFTFGGAKGSKGLGNAIEHFEEKLLKLESMMKTQTGREMAAERSSRIREFMGWWSAEQGPMTGLSNDVAGNDEWQ